MREPRRCIYCQSSFLPSPRRPQQRVCGQLDCQRRRRADSRRRKLATDPEYGQVVRDSQKKWQEEHRDYQKRYWKEHPEAAERNRQQQHVRDQRRRLQHLVKNNLVLDLKHSAAEIWLVGPQVPQVQHLEKNNLVSTQVLILPAVVHSADRAQPILKRTTTLHPLQGQSQNRPGTNQDATGVSPTRSPPRTSASAESATATTVAGVVGGLGTTDPDRGRRGCGAARSLSGH